MAKGLLCAGDLLDVSGALYEGGYAFDQVKRYSRDAIKGKRLRIKEWDYYYFCDKRFAVALTVADNSYMSLGSVSLLDFSHLRYITKSKIGLFPMGKLGMPSDCSSGNVLFKKGGVKLDFTIMSDGTRVLACEYKKFDGKNDFACELVLDKPTGDNITVAVPFQKRCQFYYNTKINCLSGRGWFKLGSEHYDFENGMGGLDWGRGVWPHKNKWYWSSLSYAEGETKVGFNLGYGFGKPTASENVVFVNGKANKLDEVKFDIPYTQGKLDYLKPWQIVDNKERLKLLFYPLIDRRDKMSAGVISTDQHQVFGKFYGKVTLDDGTILTVTDKIGFAEEVINKW